MIAMQIALCVILDQEYGLVLITNIVKFVHIVFLNMEISNLLLCSILLEKINMEKQLEEILQVLQVQVMHI